MKDDPGLPLCDGFNAPMLGVTLNVCARRLSEHCGGLKNRFPAIVMQTKSSLPRSTHLSLPTLSGRSCGREGSSPAIQTP